MKRTSILVAVMVIAGMVAVPAVGAVTQDEQEEPDVAPGERLSGVVGVQQAELDGEVDRHAYRIALEKADDNATKAGLIAEKLNETEERLNELEERKATLDEQRESGEITEGQYRAQVAELATEVDNAEAQLNQSNETAAELPAETLEENGVNVSAIQTLQQQADELSGQEVAEIARSIAGDDRGAVDTEDRSQADERDDERADDDERPDDADQQDGEQTEDDRPDRTETPEDRGQAGNGSDY